MIGIEFNFRLINQPIFLLPPENATLYTAFSGMVIFHHTM
jgi:hypothetical protein